MLEEKNDSLHDADGENFKKLAEAVTNLNVPEDGSSDNDDLDSITTVHATEGQLVFVDESHDSVEAESIDIEAIESSQYSNTFSAEDTVATEEPAADDSTPQPAFTEETIPAYSAAQSAVDAISHSNAEAGENDAPAGEDIPMKNYEALTMEDLTAELEKLTQDENVLLVKDHIEEVKREFYAKYNHLIEEKKDEHSHDNNGDTTGFEYNFPLKGRFDSLYNVYRDKKNNHFKRVQNDLQGNLEKRIAIIEELKNLISSDENIKDVLKQVNDLRERWKNAGPIPRDKYNHVWNNFHFHIERFYDHLHLDREARDIDFKHNLEQKQKIIARVEELMNEEDVPKAFRELQALHKIWKEDIGPVPRENREELWHHFSELTRQLHDKREAITAKAKEQEESNLAKKKEIIAQIEALAVEKVAAHGAWQGQIDKVEALRDQFFRAGKVPIEVNEDTWAAFKEAVRNFNALKNSFYKDIKRDQQDNLNKKLALVERAKALQESEDFEATTPVMKQIQEEWKQIGHVPRKFSDSVWKDFKEACNHYFDRLHAKRNEADTEELEAFDKKKEYLESLRGFELTGDHKTDLDAIKQHIENWKAIGRVPQARRHIEGKFNKILDALFDKLSLSKKDTDMAKFSNRLEQMSGGDDSRRLQNEQVFIMRKIDEVQGDIRQLENNIQFISNAKADNPFVKEVYKNIERHKEELNTWKEKLKQIKSMNQQ